MKKETIEEFEKNGVLDIEDVIKCYNSYIYKILNNSISNELDIEEILSDVFIIFWKNIRIYCLITIRWNNTKPFLFKYIVYIYCNFYNTCNIYK